MQKDCPRSDGTWGDADSVSQGTSRTGAGGARGGRRLGTEPDQAPNVSDGPEETTVEPHRPQGTVLQTRPLAQGLRTPIQVKGGAGGINTAAGFLIQRAIGLSREAQGRARIERHERGAELKNDSQCVRTSTLGGG
jgi:hypothetical protein